MYLNGYEQMMDEYTLYDKQKMHLMVIYNLEGFFVIYLCVSVSRGQSKTYALDIVSIFSIMNRMFVWEKVSIAMNAQSSTISKMRLYMQFKIVMGGSIRYPMAQSVMSKLTMMDNNSYHWIIIFQSSSKH